MEKPYVFLRLKHPIKKLKEFKGEIQSYEGDEIALNYRDKAAVKTVTFPDEEIEYIRLAVRI